MLQVNIQLVNITKFEKFYLELLRITDYESINKIKDLLDKAEEKNPSENFFFLFKFHSVIVLYFQ